MRNRLNFLVLLALMLAALPSPAQTLRDQIGRFDVAGYPGNSFPVVLTFPSGVPASFSAVAKYVGTDTPQPGGRQPIVTTAGNTATVTFQFPRSAFEWQGYYEITWSGRVQISGDISVRLANRSSNAPVTTLLVQPATGAQVAVSLIGGAGGSAGVTAADIAAIGDGRYRKTADALNYLDLLNRPAIPTVPGWLPSTNPNYQSDAQVNGLISAALSGIQGSLSQQAADILARLPISTYNANRATDQAATTQAQTTANQALSTAQTNALAIPTKVPMSRRIRFNGGAWQTFDADLDITVTAGQAGVTSINGKNGNLTGFLESSDLTPVTNRLTAVENGKVNIVVGQGLSSNDFTANYRNRLDSLPGNLAGKLTQALADGRYRLQSVAIPYSSLSGLPVLFSGNYLDLTNKPLIPTDNAQLANGAGYAKTTDVNSQTGMLSGRITTAQSTADAAGTAAQNAQTTANTAKTTADNNTAALTGKLGTGDRQLTYNNGTLSVGGPGGNSVNIPVGGGQTIPQGNVVYVTDHTWAGIQAKIDAVAANNTVPQILKLYGGDYLPNGASQEIQFNKNNIYLVSDDKSRIVGDNDRFLLVKIYNSFNYGIKGVGFYTPNTNGYYPMLLWNQQGSSDYGLIEDCDFFNRGDYNATGVIAFADNDAQSVKVSHNHITMRRNRISSGRMPFEGVNHRWTGDLVNAINYFTFTDNYVYDSGGSDPNNYGMFSMSGENGYATISRNTFYNCRYVGIECIGLYSSKVTGNTVITDVTGNHNGISITDGGNTERSPSNPNKGGHDITIADNFIKVPGKGTHCYYAYDIRIGVNSVSSGDELAIQHCDKVRFRGTDVKTTFYAGINFDASTNCTFEGGSVTMPSTGAAYQKIQFSNGSSFCKVMGVDFFGKNSDNGAEILLNGNNNVSKDIRLNGIKLGDNY